MITVKVKAQYLQAGDKLAGGRVVVREPKRGLYTGKGKVDIGVSKNGGATYRVEWNASTEITVERAQ